MTHKLEATNPTKQAIEPGEAEVVNHEEALVETDAQSSIEELDYIAGHETTTLVVAQAALRAKAALQSLQASIRVKDEALLPLADEMEGLLPYLAAHHFKIDSLARVVADARAALADTTKGGV